MQSQLPPPELTADLAPDPVIPEVANDQTVGELILAYREWARVARVRFDSLRAWALAK